MNYVRNIHFIRRLLMVTIKVGRRGQITIPSEIRDQIGLREGQTLALFREGDQIIMRVITETLLDLRGACRSKALKISRRSANK